MENYSYNSSYPESGDSSPRSREIEFENPPPWEDANQQPPPNYKVKFMCSYGGKIHPRPHDNQLAYVGGETKILSVDRSVKFGALLAKLVALCDSDNISFKYQLPGEDLDALISVTNDDDLEHMMHEYERLYRVSHKPARLRIFIFPIQNPSLSSSTRSFGSEDTRSEKERFVEALNSAPIIAPPPSAEAPAAAPPTQPTNVDFLFGLERGNVISPPPPPQQRVEVEDPVGVQNIDERLVGLDPIQKHIQHLQRLRLEEQQQQREFYRRKSDDEINISGTGDYYRPAPEKVVAPPAVIPGSGVPYHVAAGGGMYPPAAAVANEHQQQQVYVIPAPAGAYPTQMVRPVNAPPQQPQAYYAYQRLPPELYREHQQQQQPPQQQQMYSFTTTQSVAAPAASAPPSQGYGMVRQPVAGGGVVVTEAAGYGQIAYDSGVGRQVIYSAPPGGVVGAPVQSAAVPQYQAVPVVGGGEIRSAGGLPPEVKGVVAAAAKVTTQASV